MNVSAIYNSFDFSVESQFQDFNFNLFSGVRDWNGKVDFDYYPGSNHAIKFGANYIFTISHLILRKEVLMMWNLASIH